MLTRGLKHAARVIIKNRLIMAEFEILCGMRHFLRPAETFSTYAAPSSFFFKMRPWYSFKLETPDVDLSQSTVLEEKSCLPCVFFFAPREI